MKKLFGLTLILVFGFQLNAQEVDSKKWLISMNTPLAVGIGDGLVLPGSIGFLSATNDDETTNFLGIGGSFGYEVVNNFYAGLNLTFGRQWDEDDFSVSSFLAGPQVRYYFTQASSSLFISANAAFGGTTVGFNDEDETVNWRSFGGALGYAYSVNSTLDIEAQISYDAATATDEDDDDSDANFLGIRLGFSIHL
jgi:hypothetical protein